MVGENTENDASFTWTVNEDGARFMAFVRDLDKETDRAAVILGAAKLDQCLAQLLLAFLGRRPRRGTSFWKRTLACPRSAPGSPLPSVWV